MSPSFRLNMNNYRLVPGPAVHWVAENVDKEFRVQDTHSVDVCLAAIVETLREEKASKLLTVTGVSSCVEKVMTSTSELAAIGVIKVDKVTKGFYETTEIYEPIMEGLVKLKVTQQRPTVKVLIRLARTETSNRRRSGQQRKGNEGGGNKRADGTRERGEGPYKRVEGSNIHHERVNQRKEGTNKEELQKEQNGSKPKRTHRKKPHAASGANGPDDQKVGGESRRKILGDNTTTAGTGRPGNKPNSANRNKHKPPRDNSNHQNNPSGSKASGRNAHQGDMQAPVVNGTAAGNG